MYFSRIARDGRKQLTKSHLQNCAEYAYVIGKKFAVPEMCRLTALLHDLGKLTLNFIEYLTRSYREQQLGHKPTGRGSVIHATQGAKFLYESEPRSKDLIVALVREISAICIANHHGSLMDGISPDGDTPFQDRLIKDNNKLFYVEVIQTAAKEIPSAISELPDVLERCESELRSFFGKCSTNNLNIFFMIHFLVKSVFSCLVDADRYNAYCFESQMLPEVEIIIPLWEEYSRRLEQHIATFSADSEINAIRRDISERCLRAAERDKGIYLLDVPTGGGKTLSSLRFALNHAKKHGLGRIIYVIPYLSVLEQTAKDIKAALRFQPDNQFILEHHSNFVVSDDEVEAQAHRLLTDRWDSPIIITTMVQFLESVYSCKSSDLRKLHNMANAVFIFDEVQSMPLKCTYLFNEAVNYLHYCASCSILLCTATQPPLGQVSKPVYLSKSSSLIPDMTESFNKLKRTNLKDCTTRSGYSIAALRDFVLAKFKSEHNCLVILNTKADAARLYIELRNYITDNSQEQIDLLHLSTSMCPAHRLDTIDYIKEKKQENILCISTQLIEAGVDISFGCVVRAIAGLDSIAQAAGRCNRNGEDPNGKNVYIVNLAEENLSRLPDIKSGAAITYQILENKPPNLLSSDVVAQYYEKYYYNRDFQLSYPVNENGYLYDLLSRNQKGYGALQNRERGKKCPALIQAFKTAGDLFSVIDQRTTSVLVPYTKGIELAQIYKQGDFNTKKRLLREIGRYSVSLYFYQLEKLHELRALTQVDDNILFLDPGYHDDNLGVIFEKKSEFLMV